MKENKLFMFLGWGVVLAGFIRRFMIYLMQVSVGGGEYICLSDLTRHSYSQVLKFGASVTTTLHDPYGILIIQKFFIQLFGDGKLSLRLVPFVSSLLSLILLMRIKDWFVGKRGGLLSLCLLAWCPILIIRSAILEPYSSDVCITLLSYMLFRRIDSSTLKLKDCVLFGLAGILCVWMSLPSVFILFGGALALMISPLMHKQWQRLFRLACIFIFWGANFIFYYCYALKNFSSKGYVMNDWAGKFLPQSWNILLVISQASYNLSDIMKYHMGFSPLLGISLFVFGAVYLFRHKRTQSLILIFPIVLTMLVSCFQKYPFYGRVLIFLFPSFILMISAGCEYFLGKPKKNYLFWVGIVMAAFLVWQPYMETKRVLERYSKGKGIEPIVEYIASHHLPDDVIYAFKKDALCLNYYRDKFDLQEDSFITGIHPEHNEEYAQEINKLSAHKRVWVIFSSKVPLSYTRFFEFSLEKHDAIKEDSFASNGFQCALYKFK